MASLAEVMSFRQRWEDQQRFEESPNSPARHRSLKAADVVRLLRGYEHDLRLQLAIEAARSLPPPRAALQVAAIALREADWTVTTEFSADGLVLRASPPTKKN